MRLIGTRLNTRTGLLARPEIDCLGWDELWIWIWIWIPLDDGKVESLLIVSKYHQREEPRLKLLWATCTQTGSLKMVRAINPSGVKQI